MTDSKGVEYTTEYGVVVRLVPVRETILVLAAQKVAREFRERGEPIDPPTFKVESVGGDYILVQHRPPRPEQRDAEGNVVDPGDPGTLDVPDDPQQTAYNWALWNAHRAALERLTTAQMNEELKALLFFGVECEVPEDTAWLEEQRAFGLDVDEALRNPVERKIRYLMTRVFTTKDLVLVQSLLHMMIAGKSVSPEEIAEYEALFRRATGPLARAAAESALSQLRALVGPSAP